MATEVDMNLNPAIKGGVYRAANPVSRFAYMPGSEFCCRGKCPGAMRKH